MTSSKQEAVSPRKKSKLSIAFIVLFVGFFVGKGLFTATINQNETAALFSFGDPVGNITTPGIHFMPPWYSVEREEKRFLLYDSDPHAIITMDKKTLITDDFAPWRIVDPTAFIKSVGSAKSALTRIDDSVYSLLNASFGGHNYTDIVVHDRDAIMDTVTKGARTALKPNGIDMPIVLISRVDLPDENKQATYARMSAERNQTAQTYRSEGYEQATGIQSEADRDAKIIRADANRDATIIRGNADAEAAGIYAKAYSANPEFYKLVRGLEASEKAFGAKSGTDLHLVLNGQESILEPLLK